MMNCEKMNELLDQYLDGTLTENQAQEVDAHLAVCPDCARLFQMCQDLRAEDAEVPENFSVSWRQRIRKEEQMEKKQQKRKTFKSIAAVAAAFVFIVGGTLITRNQTTEDVKYDTYRYSATSVNAPAAGAALKRTANSADFVTEEAVYEMAATYDTAAQDGSAPNREQKLIRRVDFTIKTLEFDTVVSNLQAMTENVGGRVEYLSQYGDHTVGALRSANLTLRIPAEKLESFLQEAEDVGNITAYTNQVEDVSDSYYDIQTRLDTQLMKMERLQALLAEATEVSDLIEIESSIADTQYMIDSYQGRLKGMDDDVDFSTVTVYVQETRVVETKEATFFERVAAGIADSVENGLIFLEDACVFLLSALPWIAAVAVIVIIVRLIVKKRKK